MFLALYHYNVVIAIDRIHHFSITEVSHNHRPKSKFKLELHTKLADGTSRVCNMRNNEFETEQEAQTALESIVQRLPEATVIEVPQKRGITYNLDA